MSKFSKLDKKTRKAIIYGVIVLILVLAASILYLIYRLEERARTFTFTSDSAAANFQAVYGYGVLEQEDYESITVDFSDLENLVFDEIGNPSPQQQNSQISKKYGNLQLDLIYPRGSIYKIDGASISVSTQTTGKEKFYILTVAGNNPETHRFNSYLELLSYLEPFLYQADQNFSSLSIITDAYRSDAASIQLLSNSIGLTQYGFPSDCEIIYGQQHAVDGTSDGNARSLSIQELCPPNQATYFPGLLDSIGYMDKIDFFIKAESMAGSFPLIIDPHDSYAIITGKDIIDSQEMNAYLFIIESASRIHLSAHNNYINIAANWTDADNRPQGRFSFPYASLDLISLPGQLGYGDEVRVIDAASELQISGGEKVRTSINMTLLAPDDNPFFSTFYTYGLFEEIILNGRRLIKITEEK